MLTKAVDQVTVRLDLDPWLSLRAAAGYCGLSTRFLRGRIAEGHLPHYRPGGKVLVRRSHLDAWLEQFKRVGAQDLDAVVDGILGDFRAESNTQLGGQRLRTSARSGRTARHGETVAGGLQNDARL